MAEFTYRVDQLQPLGDRLGAQTVLGFPPGRIFYVNSNGGVDAAGYGLTRSNLPGGSGPFATIDYAINQCGATQGDVIYVLPGHTETLTSATGIALDVSGVTIIGCGVTRSRPTITCYASTTATGITVSGNNCMVKNLIFVGSDTQTTGALMAVTGTDNVIDSCEFRHGAGPLTACTMTGASRTIWKNCVWVGTAAGPDVALKIVTASVGSVFKDLLFQYVGSSGLDSAAIKGSTGIATSDCLFEGCRAMGMDATLFDINGSHASISVGDSIAIGNAGIASAAVTIANFIDGGGAVLMGNWISDAVASPAITTGAVGAITTASQRVPAGSPVT